jgi:hypothetical protein
MIIPIACGWQPGKASRKVELSKLIPPELRGTDLLRIEISPDLLGFESALGAFIRKPMDEEQDVLDVKRQSCGGFPSPAHSIKSRVKVNNTVYPNVIRSVGGLHSDFKAFAAADGMGRELSARFTLQWRTNINNNRAR